MMLRFDIGTRCVPGGMYDSPAPSCDVPAKDADVAALGGRDAVRATARAGARLRPEAEDVAVAAIRS